MVSQPFVVLLDIAAGKVKDPPAASAVGLVLRRDYRRTYPMPVEQRTRARPQWQQ
jgi:hypothetical protein